MNPRIPKLHWINRDARLIIGAKGTHALSQGFVSVVLAVYLAKIGLTLAEIGLFLGAGLAGSALLSLATGLASDRIGRRRMMVTLALLSSAGVIALALTERTVLLMAFAFIGAMNAAPAGPNPTQPLEQAGLAGSVTSAKRTEIFAAYRIIATSAAAFGSLAAGLPVLLEAVFGVNEITAFKLSFGVFALFRLATVVAYAFLSVSVEGNVRERRFTNPLTLPSRRNIFTLAGLFSFDNFAGALVVQTLMAYWFNTRFGLEIGSLALVFFGTQLMSAFSLWISAKGADRLGHINVMASTQIVAAILLIFAAFAPNAALAIVLLQVRAFFNQMDVAPRDAYLMAVVTPEERIAIGSTYIVGRNVLSTFAPSISAALWTGISASAPLVASSVLKITYDIMLWTMYHNVTLRDDSVAEANPASRPEP